MEDGKRKKKNKKNKGKPTKIVDNATLRSGGATQTGLEQNHESLVEQNHQEPDPGIVGTQSVSMSEDNATQTGLEGNYEYVYEQDHQEPDPGIVGTQNVSVSESEGELERHKAMESKFVDFEETIKHLQNNLISCIEKEASLEKKIELVQGENECFVKKEISWNLKLEQLQSEIHSWSVKEANLENKVSAIECEKDSRVWKENSISEMVARLEEGNTGLQMQVKELEISRDILVQENQKLTNSISLLEARVQHVESEAAFISTTRVMTKHTSDNKDSEKQVEAVYEPSEKLVTVDPELVRKVNQLSGTAEHSASSVSHMEADAIALPATYLSTHEENISETPDKFAYSGALFETIDIADANVDHVASVGAHPEELPLLDDLDRSTEIVQIPLDDTQVQQVEAQVAKLAEKDVPLSDAPLIGAPFRLISFVAKYVSGADLVKENMDNSSL